MPTLIIAADSTTRIAGTSPDDLDTDTRTIRLTQPEFDRLPNDVIDYPYNWNPATRLAEIIFDLVSYRAQALDDIQQQALTLQTDRFISSSLGTSYEYRTNSRSALFLLAASISDQGAMIPTFTSDVQTDRQHTLIQIRAVIRSYFDQITGIESRLRTATAAINAATTQQAIDAVML